MRWRFTLIDKSGAETEINEPVGWADVSIEVSRDKDAHGIFFDYQGNDFLFYKEAFHLLKAAYEQDGIEAYYVLKIEQECGGTELEELYRGRLLFAKAVFNCGDECFVKLPIETVSEVMTLRNRWDQKVDLQTLKGFDEVTDLEPYKNLGREVMLPAKTIVLKNEADWNFEETVSNGLLDIGAPVFDTAPESWNYGWFNAQPQFDNLKSAEFGNFSTEQAPAIRWICNGWNGALQCPDIFRTRAPLDYAFGTLLFDWQTNAVLVNAENGSQNMNFIGGFDLVLSYSMQVQTNRAQMLWLQSVVIIKKKDGGHELIYDAMKLNATWPGAMTGDPQPGTFWQRETTNTVSDSILLNNIHLEDGDLLFVVLTGLCRFSNREAQNNDPGPTFISKGGQVSMIANSQADTSPAKVFLINESLCRVAEAITDGKIRAYSDYFGRVDSEPYPALKDGCGSLEGITNGIFVRRQENRAPDQPAPMPVSLKDLFDGLNPIHNIGFGLEKDPFREGYSILRVEPWKFFYSSDVLLWCDGVNNIEKSVQDQEHFSTFLVGYEKWEAEQYNGLDEFLTKRKYRTTLSTVKNELSKLSKFIASGYALEITRRQQTGSKDWRFDNDTFIICMKRGGAKAGALIYAEDPHTFQIAVWGDDFSFWDSFFAVGDTIHIDSADNAGEFTITDIENITGNVKVTVAETVNGGLGFGTITNLTGGMAVELGNVTNPQNIIDPPTIYNYRISPARNALRWMDTILSSYRQAGPDAKIIFMDGEGNFAASGKMQSPVCRLEKEELSENQSLDISVFANAEKGLPLLRGERVSFEYPMSAKDFRTLLQLPYGIIAYRNNCEEGRGWIDNIKYQPNEGLATFTLIPEITEL